MLRELLSRVVSSVRGESTPTGTAAPDKAEIRALESEARRVSPQRRPPIYNRLGDAYARYGETPEALRAYGDALDGYLENGFYDAAAALCRKMIDVDPSVVRARCTLAFLSLGKELYRDAQREIREYVAAAQRSGQEELAIKRLHLMAEATDSSETRAMLGEVLLEIGDAEGADRILGEVHALRNELIGPPKEEQRDRWARLLRVAMTRGDGEAPPAEVLRRPRGL